MQFLKNHYEKLVLSLVLLGLAGAAFVLMTKVGNIRDDIKKESLQQTSAPQKALVPVDRESMIQKLSMATNPPVVELGLPNIVFNPVTWKKTAGGQEFPIRDEKNSGAGAVEVTAILAKNFTIELVRITGTEEKARYEFGFTAEGAEDRRNQRQKKKGLYLDDSGEFRSYPDTGTNFVFTLKEVQGAPLMPDSMVMEIENWAEPVVVTPDAPYKQVMHFVANMMHRQTGEQFQQKTKGDSIVIEGEVYNVVSVSESQVVLESPSGKRSYKELNNNGVSEQ